MKRLYFIFLFVFILASAKNSISQIVLPEVSAPVVQKISVLIPPLGSVGPKNPNASKFTEVLKNDLKNAALFDIISGPVSDPSGENIDFQALFEQGVDYVVAGQYQSSPPTSHPMDLRPRMMRARTATDR